MTKWTIFFMKLATRLDSGGLHDAKCARTYDFMSSLLYRRHFPLNSKEMKILKPTLPWLNPHSSRWRSAVFFGPRHVPWRLSIANPRRQPRIGSSRDLQDLCGCTGVERHRFFNLSMTCIDGTFAWNGFKPCMFNLHVVLENKKHHFKESKGPNNATSRMLDCDLK